MQCELHGLDEDQRFRKRARSLRSRARRSYRSRFITRLGLCSWRCFQGIVVALVIAASALNLYSERLTSLAFTGSQNTLPQTVYDRLVYAGKIWPFDQNIRWAAENWRLTFEQIVRNSQK